MPVPTILTVPNPTLRQISKPVKKFNTQFRHLVTEIETALKTSHPAGVGLSAIQVGRPYHLIYTQLPQNQNLKLSKWPGQEMVINHYINPILSYTSSELSLGKDKGNLQIEGCLSIPKVWGHVWRHQTIKLTYLRYNHQGKLIEHEDRFTDFSARVIQHEVDHLSGILFTDHILNSSPIEGFTPLKPHQEPLYFEQNGEFVKIDNPAAFAKW